MAYMFPKTRVFNPGIYQLMEDMVSIMFSDANCALHGRLKSKLILFFSARLYF